MITDTMLLSLAEECPFAVARLRRRHEMAIRAYLFDRLGDEVLTQSCLYLAFDFLLPQLAGEIGGESVAEFLRLVADCAVADYFNLRSAA